MSDIARRVHGVRIINPPATSLTIPSLCPFVLIPTLSCGLPSFVLSTMLTGNPEKVVGIKTRTQGPRNRESHVFSAVG